MVNVVPTNGREAVFDFANYSIEQTFTALGASSSGLTHQQAAASAQLHGLNVVRSHRVNALKVLTRQLASPFMILLFVTAAVSLALGDTSNSVVIGVILFASVGLGFFNEYRAEKTSEDLHSKVRHTCSVLRDGKMIDLDVTQLVPGDIVQLAIGAVVPADMRLLAANELSVDESILTGESVPVAKQITEVAANTALADLTSCLLMGTVVQSGSARAVVVATGASSVFGRIALALGEQQPQTEFQLGLKKFSMLLLQVAIALTALILITNLLLHRPLIDSIMFSLAIAVGITPQLLPAVVSTSLATGTRRLAKLRVLVKSLVSIEDLGNMDVLITDKTGTLTDGRLTFEGPLTFDSSATEAELVRLGMLAIDGDYAEARKSLSGLSQLDAALWGSAAASKTDLVAAKKVADIPFDHDRRMVSVLLADGLMVTKGSAEDVLRCCEKVAAEAEVVLAAAYAAGSRVVAVASRNAVKTLNAAAESKLTLQGFLVFSDPVKPQAAASLTLLAKLGVTVKIATGDNAVVAETVCNALGLIEGTTLNGTAIATMTDEELTVAAANARIFARVSPEQKARIVGLLRQSGSSVGFLGDGVNDALALHDADVGISVETATDVAKDAANVLLLDKELSVLAEGVREGRRIFANTMKYVLMGTSSNFGNMFSAAAASAVLPFLPMLPSQILLNNLLYDSSQLAISGDRVDAEQLQKPSHWNIGFIRRFMITFGPISSIFDFATFGLMLWVLHAGPAEFRAGWFIESLATQTLIVFVIRTRRFPFVRSRPSVGLLVSALTVVGIGAYLPVSPINKLIDFTPLPATYFAALAGMVAIYLVLVELAKWWFFSKMAKKDAALTAAGLPTRVVLKFRPTAHSRVHRRAAAFSSSAKPLGATKRKVVRNVGHR